mgnify:FL=1
MAFVVAASSCKVSRLPQSSDQADTTSVQLDTTVVPLDSTLTLIQDSVEIEIFRLLKDTLTIIGVGDIMMGTNYPDEGYLPHN